MAENGGSMMFGVVDRSVRYIRKMVLNINGFSSLKYHLHLSETILLIVAIILEISSSMCLYGIKKTCAGQCLLFAKVYERPRILQGSPPIWCYLPIFLNVAAIASSVFVFRFIKGRRYGSHNSCLRVLGLVSFSAFLAFLSSWIISSGFRGFCKSFVINRCSHEHIHSMDWRKFTPKYCDCDNAYIVLLSTETSSWCACFLLCVVCVTHAVRLFTGLQTTSTS